MIKANYNHKSLIVDILSKSFDENKSVNYVIKQDRNRKERIRRLMEYSFEICFLFGEIYLNEDKSGCALVLYPEKKRTTLKTLLLDVKLAFFCIGVTRVRKVLQRESKIKRNYPKSPLTYLWFIGVYPAKQKSGIGSALLKEVLKESFSQNRHIYLETSIFENLKFYKRNGFKVYNKLKFDHTLYLLKREI